MNKNKEFDEARLLTGQRLKTLRLRAKLSQANLAKIMGVCVHTIIGWEKGRGYIYGRHLRKFHKLYGVTIDYILGLSDNENQFWIDTSDQH